MLQNQHFVQSLIELRSHYQSLQDEYERSITHVAEQLNHINALLVDQLVEDQQQFVESLLQLREHYQALHSQEQQKSQSAKKQIAHVNALLADSLVLQHSQQQPISIQSATLEQQALFGVISSNGEESQRQSPELAREPKLPEMSEQVASDISQGEHDKAIATPTKESPQQSLEVVESPESLAISEPQIPADSSQGQQNGEKPLLQEPESPETPPQIPTDFHQGTQDLEKPLIQEPEKPEPQSLTDSHQAEQQPESEPSIESPDDEDSFKRWSHSEPPQASLQDLPANSPSSRQAAPLKTPLLPQYQHLSKSEAIENLLHEHSGTVLHVNYIIRALYGELTLEDVAAEKPRMNDSLKKGVAKGLWDRVPDSPGYYTADMKLVEEEAPPEKIDVNMRQGRKPNSKATEGMLPRYLNLTFTDAVESVLRDRVGEIVTTDIMARALYGDLEGQELTEARNKVGKIMWSGGSQGRWQRVPGQKGAYTLDMKLLK